MKRGMIAMSAVMAMGMANLLMADNMSERFAAHPKYAEYLDINKTDPQQANLIKRQMAQEICDQIFLQVEAECNSLAKKGVRARYEKWDLQTKVNFCNLYLKSKKILASEAKRSTFNPNLSNLVETIYYRTGTSEAIATRIKNDFAFNDGGVFANEMLEIAKIADEIVEKDKVLAKLQESTAKLQESTANWNEILKKLEELAK
jgi:hypothetical protein